jgi:hypothetical protein
VCFTQYVSKRLQVSEAKRKAAAYKIRFPKNFNGMEKWYATRPETMPEEFEDME